MLKEPFLALKASAGSGKTFALSVRYIALILSGESVKSITALTFTKKAASEMSVRIVNTFLNLQNKDAELNALCQMLNTTKDDVLLKRDRVRSEFLDSNLKVMTFDSFFGLILRCFALNLGLSPDYEIKNSDENLIRQKFIDKVSNFGLLNSLANYIVAFSKGQNDFFSTILALYENLDHMQTKQNLKKPDSKILLDLCADIKNYIELNGGSNTAVRAFDIKNIDELLAKDFLCRDSLDYKTFSKIYTQELDDKFINIKDELRCYLNQLENYKINELCDFLNVYIETKRELNRELNKLSFSDVAKITNSLLTQNIDKDMLYFRLDGTIKHLLIDEFQDTNVRQYDIIYPLIAEIVSGYGQSGLGSFFYVGDKKQSIYRFRGGKKELFDKVASDFKHINTRYLDTNYRSSRLLVEFVNETFKDKIDDFSLQNSSIKDSGYIEILQTDDIIDSAIKKTKWLLDQGVLPSSITILCWKNDDIKRICEALKLAKINASDEGAMLLKNSPSVFVLINYVKFCIFKHPLFAKNISAYLGYTPKCVELDFHKTAKENLYYLAKVANISLRDPDILKILQISSGYQDIVSFVYEFENLDATLTQNDNFGVRVMTAHKSKGLEFNHVILCDKLSKDRPDTDKFKLEYDIKNGWQIRLKVKNREFLDDEYAKFLSYCKELDRAEEINKLYVAMTRAKDSLIIIKSQNPSGTNPSYFSKYLLKNDEEICYLDLQCMKIGELNLKQDNKDIVKNSAKNIELVEVAKDDSSGKDESYDTNLNAIYFGLALHYLLEMSDFCSDSILYQTSSMINKFSKFLNKNELNEVVARALNLVKNDKFIELTSGKIIKKEQSITYNNQLKQIDLLIFSGSDITIIDYKSSKLNIEKNISQVKDYVDIVSSIYPNYRVSGVVFYVLSDKIEQYFI